MRDYWFIEDCGDNSFPTLRDAKFHTTFWTKEEKKKYDKCFVLKVENDEVTRCCQMIYKNGKLKFTRTMPA